MKQYYVSHGLHTNNSNNNNNNELANLIILIGSGYYNSKRSIWSKKEFCIHL